MPEALVHPFYQTCLFCFSFSPLASIISIIPFPLCNLKFYIIMNTLKITWVCNLPTSNMVNTVPSGQWEAWEHNHWHQAVCCCAFRIWWEAVRCSLSPFTQLSPRFICSHVRSAAGPWPWPELYIWVPSEWVSVSLKMSVCHLTLERFSFTHQMDCLVVSSVYCQPMGPWKVTCILFFPTASWFCPQRFSLPNHYIPARVFMLFLGESIWLGLLDPFDCSQQFQKILGHSLQTRPCPHLCVLGEDAGPRLCPRSLTLHSVCLLPM